MFASVSPETFPIDFYMPQQIAHVYFFIKGCDKINKSSHKKRCSDEIEIFKTRGPLDYKRLLVSEVEVNRFENFENVSRKTFVLKFFVIQKLAW